MDCLGDDEDWRLDCDKCTFHGKNITEWGLLIIYIDNVGNMRPARETAGGRPKHVLLWVKKMAGDLGGKASHIRYLGHQSQGNKKPWKGFRPLSHMV